MVIVTHHAKERMLERRVCAPRKIQRMADKAWVSEQWARRLGFKYNNRRGDENVFYRLLNGYIFTFRLNQDGVPVLITVTDTSNQL